MNSKQIAAIFVVVIMLIFVQATIWIKNHSDVRSKEEDKAKSAANTAAMQVLTETRQYDALKVSTKEMIRFLEAWSPYFNALNTPQSAELAISMRIKEANLLTLGQRYEVASTKGDPTIPKVMRANLIVEDDYAKTVNWLGKLEVEIPTLRISNMRLSKGQLSNDIKAELVFEVPLASQ